MASTKTRLNSAMLVTGCLLLQTIFPLAAIAQPQPAPRPPACLSGYPDGSYRGDQPLTRDEYAAGMNACLEQITPQERLLRLQPNRANLATRDEFRALIERQRELNQQLRELSGRIGEVADPKPPSTTP